MFSFVNDAQHLKSQGCFIYFFDIVAAVVYVLIHPLGAIPVTIFMPAITIMLAKTHPHSTVNGS